jgi:D-cysteine desulfhydrase
VGTAFSSERPLLTYLPEVGRSLQFAELGRFPTRVEPLTSIAPDLAGYADAYVKREDISADVYGGNKIRTLEVLFGGALRQGATRIYATGAFGSNHAAATVLHAARVGLESGALLFPQPPSRTAADNLQLVATRANDFVPLRHWSSLPLAAWRTSRRWPTAAIMAPGGAVPLGALGYVSAALELAEQVRAGELPAPERIVLGVGSTCTSAGLLLGLRVARVLGIAFASRVPTVVAVRVSPWPVTSPLRIARLARKASSLLASLASHGERFDFSFAELRAGLVLDRRFIGAGYGKQTASGLSAIREFGAFGEQSLDTTYSAKSAAGYLAWLREHSGPSLYWATKSSMALPRPSSEALANLSPAVKHWLARC